MSPDTVLPTWRSLLYVPANVPRFVEKAHERGADAIILDLEDSVPYAEKAAARSALGSAASSVARNGAEVLVRINRPEPLAVADIEAAIQKNIAGLLVSKADSPSHLHFVDELVSKLETERGIEHGHTKFVVVVETPQAFLDMPEIFRASGRTVAAILGSEDFALACDMVPNEDTLLFPKQQMIIAARACGILPFGLISSVVDFSDPARFRSMVVRSKSFGFAGATCIHPGQVRIVNEVYTPSVAEIEEARKILEVDEAARKNARGSASLDGKMIDAPVAERARRLLKRVKAVR